MAVTHPAAVRDVIANAVCDSIDDGAGAGTLIFQTSGDVEVATCTFSDPAFGAASSGTCTASTITDDTSAAGGTTTKFKIQDSNSADKGFAGSVTATSGGGDIELSSTTIGVGDTVSVTSLTYSAPS
jgi:hypothetical protein